MFKNWVRHGVKDLTPPLIAGILEKNQIAKHLSITLTVDGRAETETVNDHVAAGDTLHRFLKKVNQAKAIAEYEKKESGFTFEITVAAMN